METCEACNQNMVTIELIDKADLMIDREKGKHFNYNLCNNCLLQLVTYSLSKEQYRRLIQNGHTNKEFYLHDDFYDEEGNAIQPKLGEEPEPSIQDEYAEEYAEDVGGEIVKDMKTLDKIKEKLWDAYYYGQGWSKINGGFVNVEELAVVKYKTDADTILYKVFAKLEHGEQDMGDGCAKTYTENLDFMMNEKLEPLDRRKDG